MESRNTKGPLTYKISLTLLIKEIQLQNVRV